LRIPIAEIQRVARLALEQSGCNSENATAVAHVVAAADRDGCASHGLFRLPGYLAALRSGKVNGKANPSVVRLAPSVLQVHGSRGFAPISMNAARQELEPLARQQGIAAAALVDVHHFSALWVDIEPLVQRGLGAFCFTAYMPVVAPAGATHPFFGTNPMAFGWPRADGGSMIFDQASATMARGEVMIAARDGRELPLGVGLDVAGMPTKDPAAILSGVLLPFGGHKGSAIALMVELLAAGLIGQPFSVEAGEEDNGDGGPPRGGVLLIAFEPRHFGDPDGWLAHSEAFLERLSRLDDVRLPGQRRAACRAQSDRDGAEIAPAVWEFALRASSDCGSVL